MNSKKHFYASEDVAASTALDALISDLDFSLKVFGSVQRIQGALTSILQKHIRLPVLSVELFIAQADAALTAASRKRGGARSGTGDSKSAVGGGSALSDNRNSSAVLTNRLLARFTQQAQRQADADAAAGGGDRDGPALTAAARPRLEIAAKFRTHVCPQEQGVLFFSISSVPMPFVFAPADGSAPREFSTLDDMQQYMARKGVKMEAKQQAMAQPPRVRLCRAPLPEMAIALSSLHVGKSMAFELDKLTAPELRAKFAHWTWDGILPLTPMECGWGDQAEQLGTSRGGAARTAGMRLVPVPPSEEDEDLPCPVQSMAGHMARSHSLMWAFEDVKDTAVASARGAAADVDTPPPSEPPQPEGGRSALLADLVASRGSPEAAASMDEGGDQSPPSLAPEQNTPEGPPPEPWKNAEGIIPAVPGSFDPRRVITLSGPQLEGLNVQGFDFPVALWLTPREVLSPSVLATGILGAAQLLSEYTKASCWHAPAEHAAPFDITEIKLGPLGPPPLTLLPASFFMEPGSPGTPNSAGSALLQLHDLVLQFTAVGAGGEAHSCEMYLQRMLPASLEEDEGEAAALDHVAFRCVKVGAGLDEVSSANVWRAQESVFMLQELLEGVCDEGDCLRSVPSGCSRNSEPIPEREEQERAEALGILNARVSDSTSLLLTKYSAVVEDKLEHALPRSVHAAVHAVVAGRLLQRQQLMQCLEQVGLRVWPTWRLLNRPGGSAADKAKAAKQAADRSKAMSQKVAQLRAKKLVGVVTGQEQNSDSENTPSQGQPQGGSTGAASVALDMTAVEAARSKAGPEQIGSSTARKLRQAELQQAAADRAASKMQETADAAAAAAKSQSHDAHSAAVDELSSDASLGKPKGKGAKKPGQSSAVVPAAAGEAQAAQDGGVGANDEDSDSDDEGALSAFCRSCLMACSDGVKMHGEGSEGAVDFLMVSVPRHVMEERAEHLGMRVRVHPKNAQGAFLYEFDEDNFLRGAPMQPFWRNSLARPYPYEGYFQDFTPAQRHTLLLDLIMRARASAFGFSNGHRVHLEHASGGADINFVELTAEGVIADSFPLHNPVGLHGLQRFWVHAPTTWMDIPAMYYTRGLLAQLQKETLSEDSARRSAHGILGALVQNRLATGMVVQQLTGERPMNNWTRIVSAVGGGGRRKQVDVAEAEGDEGGARDKQQGGVRRRRAAKQAKSEVSPADNPLLVPAGDAASVLQEGPLDDTSGQSINTLRLLHAIQADRRDLPDDGLHLVKGRTQGEVGTAADLAAVITVDAPAAKADAGGKGAQGGVAAPAASEAARVTETQAANIRVALVSEIQSARQESERRRGACSCCCFRCACCSCCGKQCCVSIGAWWTWWWNASLGSSLRPPLHLVRGYFGTQSAFYFLFLRVYTGWLALPALYGLLVFISPYLFDTTNTPVVDGSDVSQQDALVASYAVLTVLWATFMIETIAHQQGLSAYKWGVGALGSSPVRSVAMYSQTAGGVQADEDDNGHSGGMGGGGYGGAAASQNLRGEFIADMQGDDRDDSVQLNTLQGVFDLDDHPRGRQLKEQLRRDISTYNELYFFPADSRRWRYAASTAVVVFMIGLVVAVVAAVLILPDQIFSDEDRLLGVPVGDLISGVVNGLIIPTLSFSFSRLAVKLTRFERHPYQNDYDASLTLKLASFTFVNSYISLFILAFYIQDLDRLGTQLGAIMITGQVVGTIKESGIMWALDRYRRLKNKKVLARLSQMFSLQSGGTVGLVSVSRESKPAAGGARREQASMVQGNTGVLRLVAEEQRQADVEEKRRKLRHFARFAAAMDSDSDAERSGDAAGGVSDSDSDADDSVLAASAAMQMLVRRRGVARAAAAAARRGDGGTKQGTVVPTADAAPEEGTARLRSLLQRSHTPRPGPRAPAQGETAPQLAKALRSIVRLQKQRKRQVDVYDSIKLSGLHTAITEVGRQQRDNMLEEYMEMITQFGFVALFAAAFPLAAAASLLNNLIEIRSDAQKMLVLRRSFARDTSGFGIWLQLMKLISLVAVFTNFMLIYIGTQDANGSSRLVAAVAGYDAVGIIQVFVVAEHIIIALKLLLRKVIPDTPAEVVEDRYRERYFLLKAIDESARVNKSKNA